MTAPDARAGREMGEPDMVMRNVAWDDTLKVGDPELDEDHRRLVNTAAELYAAAFAGVGTSVLRRALDKLEGYAVGHFAREEESMRLARYPGLDAHRRQHAVFADKIDALKRALGSEPADTDVAIDTIVFLNDWIHTHVAEADRDYRPYLTAR